jgi:glycine/D-amino acid oxidase-like deaminating enzyme
MTFDFDRRSRSLWMDFAVAPTAPTLTGDQTCDTVIVGAGMAGISTAYELSTQGQKIIVIDRGGNRRGHSRSRALTMRVPWPRRVDCQRLERQRK